MMVGWLVDWLICSWKEFNIDVLQRMGKAV
jgi:hypothetical protein